MSSSKYMLFTERPLGSDNVLAPSRQIGIAGFYTGKDNRWTFHTGFFAGPDAEDPNGCLVFAGGKTQNNECDEQFSVAARGTFLPYMQDRGGVSLFEALKDQGLKMLPEHHPSSE